MINTDFKKLEKEFSKTSLKEDVKSLNPKFFTTSKDGFENVIKREIKRQEKIYFIPTTPLLKPGTLLGNNNTISCDIDDLEEQFYKSSSGLRAMSLSGFDEPCLSMKSGRPSKEFFEYKKVMENTLMVTIEQIEIVKSSTYIDFEHNNSTQKKISSSYNVVHYIDVINGTQTETIRTDMFQDQNLTSDNFDLEKIEQIYYMSDIKKLISPLEIVSKNK